MHETDCLARAPHHDMGGELFRAARINLARVVEAQAGAMAELCGFAWIGVPDAPDNMRELTLAYARSSSTGRPLPVSNLYCENIIYRDASSNEAFRFWHDVTHLRLGAGFDLDGEITVARAQLDILRATGYREGSIEYELLHRDTLGQTLLGLATGHFPPDQLCFARVGVVDSLGAALRAETAGPAERFAQRIGSAT